MAGTVESVDQQAIYFVVNGYPEAMTKRLIDVDDAKLDAVRDLLGTRTLKATVNEAFDEVIALDARRRALLSDHGADMSLLTDPEARNAAWG